MQQVILSNGGGANETSGRQPKYKANVDFYFLNIVSQNCLCPVMFLNTLSVNMKNTCFIFEYMEAGGIWLPTVSTYRMGGGD